MHDDLVQYPTEPLIQETGKKNRITAQVNYGINDIYKMLEKIGNHKINKMFMDTRDSIGNINITRTKH